ncbi:MAG: hypothetical protein ABWK01_08585 [Infirmifilum sp.]
MKKYAIFITLLFVLQIFLNATCVSSQPSYWIALNFRVTFNADGTAVVDAKLHPFTVDGKSLFNNKEVEANIRNQSVETLNYILLMFSDNPRLLNFQVLTDMEKRYGESVLCDVAGTGKMSKFDGAYVYSVKIYLNTSNYVSQLNDSLFEVKLRDSFTSTDPRSWIDVLEVVFNGTTPVKIDWEPRFAHGPTYKTQNSLTWINYNEQEAPDIYVFQLRIPGLKYVGEPAEVKAAIKDATLDRGILTITVENLGSTSGYVYLVVKDGGEQSRKIYLFSRETKEVIFPFIQARNITVLLYSGAVLLQRKNISAISVFPTPSYSKFNIWGIIALIIALALFSIFTVWLRSRKNFCFRKNQQVST